MFKVFNIYVLLLVYILFFINVSYLYIFIWVLLILCMYYMLYICFVSLYFKLVICVVIYTLSFFCFNLYLFYNIFSIGYLFFMYLTSIIIYMVFCIYSYSFSFNHASYFIYVLFIFSILVPCVSCIYIYILFLPEVDWCDENVLQCVVIICDILFLCVFILFIIFITLRIFYFKTMFGSFIKGYYISIRGLYSVEYSFVSRFFVKYIVVLSYFYVFLYGVCLVYVIFLKFSVSCRCIDVCTLLVDNNSILSSSGIMQQFISSDFFFGILMIVMFLIFTSILRIMLLMMQKENLKVYEYIEYSLNWVLFKRIFYYPENLYRSIYIDSVLFIIRFFYIIYLRSLLPDVACLIMFLIVAFNLYVNIEALPEEKKEDIKIYYRVIIVILLCSFIFILFKFF